MKTIAHMFIARPGWLPADSMAEDAILDAEVDVDINYDADEAPRSCNEAQCPCSGPGR